MLIVVSLVQSKRLLLVCIPLVLGLSLLYSPGPGDVCCSPAGVIQGDIVLGGSDVEVIEGEFAINGSILVRENATLIMRNARVSFIQAAAYEHNITLEGGQPVILVENVTVDQGLLMKLDVWGDSSAEISGLKAPMWCVHFYDTADAVVEDSSLYFLTSNRDSKLLAKGVSAFTAEPHEDSSLRAVNCSFEDLVAWGGDDVVVENCSLQRLVPVVYSANYSLSGIKPGFVSSWSFLEEASVSVAPGGTAPALEILDTQVDRWAFSVRDRSWVALSDSSLDSVYVYDDSFMNIVGCESTGMVRSYTRARIHVINSTIAEARPLQQSSIWLLDSTSAAYAPGHSGAVYSPAWCLDVHVLDSEGVGVPGTSVAAHSTDLGTVVTAATGLDGWTSLVLGEKLINATGTYGMGPYRVEAVHAPHLAQTVLSMDGHKSVEMRLDELVVGELGSGLLMTLPTLLLLLRLRCRR